tara:strand:+ start:7507 stop:8580 length:1074 start_codon:yes stop_codon:yes gene_type:complete
MSDPPPEVQAQLEEQKKNCPFCKIIKGEIESKKVFEDDKMLGILDINPRLKGHTLLLPKEHYPILPFLPPETFRHMFGKMSEIIKAMKESMLATGCNVMIANGGVAGQQSPHFLVHIFPREEGDGFDKYGFEKKKADDKEVEDAYGLLAKNVPIMMNNHFGRNPMQWHTGNVETADHLKDRKENGKFVYEDEKLLVMISENPQTKGHLVIYPQESIKAEDMEEESSFHFWSCASLCATAVYEGLGAAGSNIILKTGRSNDNPDGHFMIEILARYEGDGIDVLGEPGEGKDLDTVAGKIKDKMFMVEHAGKKEDSVEVIDMDKERKVVGVDHDLVKAEVDFNEAEKEILDALKDISGD